MDTAYGRDARGSTLGTVSRVTLEKLVRDGVENITEYNEGDPSGGHKTEDVTTSIHQTMNARARRCTLKRRGLASALRTIPKDEN